MTSRTLPAAAIASLVAIAAVLGGCAAQAPTVFHTLIGPGAAAPAPLTPGLRFRIEAPVRVPPQVDRPQMVVRRADGSLQVLERQRWVAPLADEWRDAIAGELSRRLGALDVSHVSAPPGPPPYRLQLELQRFDSRPGDAVAQQAQWSLTRPGDPAPSLTCITVVQHPAGADASGVAQAQRDATLALAAKIAAALRNLQAGAPPACPA